VRTTVTGSEVPAAMPPGCAGDAGRRIAPDLTAHPQTESGRTITALVAEAAQRFSQAPALRDSTGRTLLHAELQERAKATGSFLIGLGLDRARPIGILVDHRIESVVAMLGILGAGHFYLPLDPRWPGARIEALANRLGLECLFADETSCHKATDMPWRVPSLRHLIRLDLETADWPDDFEPTTVTALWDEVAARHDWAEAAGFGTFEPGPGQPAAAHEMAAAYYRHIEQLAAPFLGPGSRVLEIGCGTGEVAGLIAPRAAEYVGVDPSGVALARLTGRCSAARGLPGFAHRLPDVGRDFDLAIFSSVIQFFPGIDYFVTSLIEAARHLTADARILIADLVDPGHEEHAGLRLPPEFFTEVVASFAGVRSCDVVPRSRGEVLPGRGRFDVVLTLAARSTLAAGQRAHRWTGWHVARSPARPSPEISGGDLAYTIFTSGSTGTPKGVAVAHAEVARVVEWMNDTFGVRPGDTLLFVTAFSFDLSVYDVFGTLAAGACVRVLSDRELSEPESLTQALAEEPVTIWDSAPAAMQRVLPLVADAAGGRGSLRLVLLSGDWIPVPMPDRIRELFPGADVVSLGGATECTIWSNYYLIREVDPNWPSIPYGRAMPHAHYAVLDAELRPCPAGVPGDLYIGGDCLAIGYVGDAARTAERFIPDPLAAAPGRRIYATGDRALWLDDGNLRFLGRLDDQVKVHGYRIELGEIQSNLAACPHVQDCAVIAAGQGTGRKLVGFYVPSRSSSTCHEIAAWLGRILPAYMVPGDLIPVAQLPVSVNGKLDRAALARQYTEICDSAIRGGLARAWSRAIGREPRTIDEDFFEAGADSMAAAQLTLLIREETEVLLDVAEVFAAPTVRGLARKASGTWPASGEPRIQGNVAGPAPA
jgi:amino acid adenylation domain-containing protein